MNRLIVLMIAMLAMFVCSVTPANATIGMNGTAGDKVKTKPVVEKKIVVHAGETKELRGLTCTNQGNKDITLQPVGAQGVDVQAPGGSTFTVAGMESCDMVEDSGGSSCTVSGTGGTINMASSSNATATCVAGGTQLDIKLPGGSTSSVSAGNTATYHA